MNIIWQAVSPPETRDDRHRVSVIMKFKTLKTFECVFALQESVHFGMYPLANNFEKDIEVFAMRKVLS